MKLRHIRRAFAAPLLATALATVATPGTAHAAPKEFVADITVNDDGAAVATVSDTILPNNRYTIALTADGWGFCSIVMGDTIDLAPSQLVTATATGAGNPATASTPGGGCLNGLGYASMTYTLTWVGIPGTAAQLQVQCTWLFRVRTCSPSRFKVDGSVLPI